MGRMNSNPDFWPKEREGFVEPLRPAYAAVRFTPSPRRTASLKLEERVGSVIAGGGLVWAAQVASTHTAILASVAVWPPGPLEVCAIGVLVWMHAKWRRSLRHY